jgi:hypothetical protein
MLACVFALSAGAATAGPAHPPAKPTLEGTWAHNYILVFESPASAPGLVVANPSEAKAVAATEIRETTAFFDQALDVEVAGLLSQSDGLPVVRGERRSRILVEPADGKLPYRPQVRAQLSGPPPGDPPGAFDNPESRPNADRCLVGVGQPPLTQLSFAYVLQIVKTPGLVAIHSEYGDDVRIVPITDQHGSKTFTSRLGDSIGRWEGDTLVVETIGMPAGDSFRLAPIVLISDAAVVTERFTPVSDNELLYQFTVNDPKLYTAPWRAEFSWYRTKKLMYEHACHEGNYSLPNELAGARYQERAKAGGAPAGKPGS